jgi:hypothetical protein
LITLEPQVRRGVGANRPTETWVRYRAREQSQPYEPVTLPAEV